MPSILKPCRIRKNAFSNSGYTLIELAVVLVVIGLLIATFTPIYTVDVKQRAVKESVTNLASINTAIGEFRTAHGRYPCPASLTANRSDPKYGFEDCSDMSAIPPGSCASGGGICIQSGQRDVTLPNGTVLHKATAPLVRVRTGGVPFRQLNLQEDEALDGWDDRYTYAVTENLIFQDLFGFDGGAIDVRNGLASTQSVLNPPNTADFIVSSPGADRAGAYTRDGVLFSPCPPATEPESANCSHGDQAVFTIMQQYTAGSGSTTQFDDLVSYYSRGDTSPWQLAEDTSGNIYYVSKGASLSPAIRLLQPTGTTDPNVTAQNDGDTRVRGNLDGTGGNLKTGDICDYDGLNCTSAKAIGGDLADSANEMQCPNSHYPPDYIYMTGIEENHAKCAPDVKVVCAKGQAMTGVGPDGSPVCSSTPCPSVPVDICGSSQTLPEAAVGSPPVTLSGGANYSQKYVCVGGSGPGSWQPSGKPKGKCDCNPTETATQTLGCGDGFTGKIKQQHTRQCPSGQWSDWVDVSNTCKCVGDTDQQDLCPSGGGNTGSHIQTRQFVCNANGTAGSWTPWQDSGTNTCACSDTNKQQTLNCPTGQKGSIIQVSTFSCASQKWGSWKEQSNTCQCDSSKTDTRTISCPSRVDSNGVVHEQVGEIKQTRSIQCPSSNWGDWTDTSNTCQDKPAVVCYWSSQGSGTSGTSGFGSEVGSVCTTCGSKGACHQTLGSQAFKNYSSCSCN